ncbi:MAG TPA: capsule assembly Wzi family protein [Candidatus Eisenbacteria bacterium]
MKRWLWVWGSLAALWVPILLPPFPATARPTYIPSERIPTNSPVYRDLERLAETFGRTPRFLSMRPLRVAEAEAFLEALVSEYPDAESDPAYLRARRELDPDWRDSTRPLLYRTEGEEMLSVSPYVSVRYEEDPRNRPDVNRDYRLGARLAAAPDSSAVFVLDAYAGTASQGGRGTPNFGTGNALIEGVDVNTWMEEAYLEFRAGSVRVLAGHTWLRWGPGREGTLALSDAAPALDLARAEVGLFRAWRLQWFVSILDPGAQTYLAGHRVEWSPSPRFTAGVTELARFDGTSQAPLYLIPLVPYSFWEKRPKTSTVGAIPGDTTGLALTKNNVLMSADVSWVPRPGWRLWGELMVDDISFSRDYKPDMVGYQAGIETRRRVGGAGGGADEADRGSGHMLNASIEYTRVNNFTYSVWHKHDFDSQGFPIGFVLGPDVASLASEIAYEHSAAWELRVRGEWRKKGEGRIGDFYDKVAGGTVDAAAFQGVVERETRAGGTLIYTPKRWLRVEGTVGASEMKNRGHLPGGPDREAPFRVAAILVW